jgi:hypothetical protein
VEGCARQWRTVKALEGCENQWRAVACSEGRWRAVDGGEGSGGRWNAVEGGGAVSILQTSYFSLIGRRQKKIESSSRTKYFRKREISRFEQ